MNPKNELKSIVESGRIPNSLLFQGPVGSGKLLSAIDFANSILGVSNAPSINIDKKISHPDLHVVFPIPASDKKTENSCDFYINSWRNLVLENNYQIENPNQL